MRGVVDCASDKRPCDNNGRRSKRAPASNYAKLFWPRSIDAANARKKAGDDRFEHKRINMRLSWAAMKRRGVAGVAAAAAATTVAGAILKCADRVTRSTVGLSPFKRLCTTILIR